MIGNGSGSVFFGEGIPGRGSIPLHSSTEARTRRIGFMLLPDFALLAYSCAMEPYRAANVLAGRELYRWLHISPNGQAVRASNGVTILPDHGIEAPLELDDLFICSGGNPALFDDHATFSWLREQSHRIGRIGSVSGGAYALARAGLLDGYRCTVHWEYLPAMAEAFPRLWLTRTIYEIDRTRCTAAGGTAALDMMAALIAAEYGLPLANAVNEWFLHTRPRASGEPQRMSLRERYNITNPTLLKALERMEEAIEDPETRERLAQVAGVSVRQLERLFQAHLGRTIHTHYVGLRLERARSLLAQTSLPVLEIALACGFTTAAHFSRAFKTRFGMTPQSDRKQAWPKAEGNA